MQSGLRVLNVANCDKQTLDTWKPIGMLITVLKLQAVKTRLAPYQTW